LGFLDTEPHTTGVGPFLLCVAELKRRLANMTLSLDEESVTEEVEHVLFFFFFFAWF
jgi:hypothetical protein